MSLASHVVRRMAEEIRSAPRRKGARREVVQALADRYGVSAGTVYRLTRPYREAEVRRRRGARTGREEYREWVGVAVRWAARSGAVLDDAIAAAVEAGDLPREALAMPLSTAYRVRRELGLRPAPKRTQRLHAEYPWQAVQIDGSHSAHMAVLGREGGDWRLKFHRRRIESGGYKNKPLPPGRERLVYYALWDMCTGYTVSRGYCATGERSADALDFLVNACQPSGDPRLPAHGVPHHLWTDQGPLFKGQAAANLLEALDIEIAAGMPYAKTRMGGVERGWRSRWRRFETALGLRGDTILLSELNDRLAEYDARENTRRPSRTPVGGRPVSRSDAWAALSSRRPADRPLHAMPADALAAAAVEARRKLNNSGVFSWDSVQYEVPDWNRCWVICRRPLVGEAAEAGRVVAELEGSDPPERREARRLEPKPYGHVRAAAATPYEKLMEEPAPEGAPDVYAPAAEAGPPRLMRRASPAQPLDNPMDTAGVYASQEDAVHAFATLYPWPLPPSLRSMVAAEILAEGLDRDAVRALAAELAAVREAS